MNSILEGIRPIKLRGKLWDEAQNEEPVDRDELEDAMTRVLTGEQRFVLGLYFWQDAASSEIGEALGVSESRISQIRSAGLKRLAAALA